MRIGNDTRSFKQRLRDAQLGAAAWALVLAVVSAWKTLTTGSVGAIEHTLIYGGFLGCTLPIFIWLPRIWLPPVDKQRVSKTAKKGAAATCVIMLLAAGMAIPTKGQAITHINFAGGTIYRVYDRAGCTGNSADTLTYSGARTSGAASMQRITGGLLWEIFGPCETLPALDWDNLHQCRALVAAVGAAAGAYTGFTVVNMTSRFAIAAAGRIKTIATAEVRVRRAKRISVGSAAGAAYATYHVDFSTIACLEMGVG